MRIIFTKNYENYVAGKDYDNLERTLARRFVSMEVAIPYSVHLENLEEKRVADLMSTKKEKTKEAAEKKKANELLEKKEETEKETAESKNAVKRNKNIKK